MRLVIGNIIALIASILFVYSGALKNKKKIIFFQCVQKALSTLSNIVLKGYSGAIIHAVSFVRNILCYFDKSNIPIKIILSIITIVLTFLFNNLGLIGMLPLISTLLYLWFMDIKDIIKFKYLMLITIVLWCIYDLTIKSYTSFLFGIFSAITTIISMIQIKNKENKNERN